MSTIDEFEYLVYLEILKKLDKPNRYPFKKVDCSNVSRIEILIYRANLKVVNISLN